MRKILILVAAWIAIWALTLALPTISPGWLPFLPVLYPTYSIIIRRRNPGVQRTIAAMLTILLLSITFEWAMSHMPKASARLLSIGSAEKGQRRIDVYVYEGRCSVPRFAFDEQTQTWRADPLQLPPAWMLFVATAVYPAFVLWHKARRRRDHVRDTCLICTGAGILFVGIFVVLTNLLSATEYRDVLVDVLAVPPAILFLGSVVGFVWFVQAVQSLRRRPVARAAKTILLTMSISAAILAMVSAFSMGALPIEYIDILPTLAALALGSVVFFITCQYLHRRLPILYPSGQCQRCGYNLTGNVSGVCPECGEKVQRL